MRQLLKDLSFSDYSEWFGLGRSRTSSWLLSAPSLPEPMRDIRWYPCGGQLPGLAGRS
ncbi:hypothetical protein [Micromonospora gifhornensis]|uniref:hypothetical protein n=1 Tax=Micromonospora gifhornensis TaxID=84594 RepID=UPI001954BEDC|nr:hypothetical protein [Micromonospora gifhornensis]